MLRSFVFSMENKKKKKIKPSKSFTGGQDTKTAQKHQKEATNNLATWEDEYRGM